MSQKYTQDGVELVVAGLRKFQGDLKQAGVSWDSAVQGFRTGSDQLSEGMGAATQAGAGLTAGSAGLAAAIGLAGGAAIMAAFAIGKKLVQALGDAFNSMKQVGMRALMLAGEFQEMEFAALAIGRAMGKSKSEIQGSVQELVDLGIRVDKANKIVAQFTRYQLDLASATDLVRIAQATGIMMHRDSSEEMESLVHAALSGSTIMLRQRGIFIDAAKAAKDYAKELGRDVETLTQAEKAQARLNAIIESAANVLDVYGEAMKSPTKRLRTLTSREIPDLLALLGAPFLDAWATAVGAISSVVTAISEAAKEGGSLYPVLVNLGAAAALVADGFKAAAKFVVKWIEDFDVSVTQGFTGIIEKMFTFGFELVAFFARGIVTATTTVLIGAMKAISWVLTNWLAPSSPPKVAPKITQWGIDVMAEYLRGFTLADFSILEGILGPLSRILKGPSLAKFSQELIAALAGGGELTESFYERIARAAGKYGKEVAELTRRHVELIRATEAVAAAEKRLEDAQEGLLKSQQQITAERRKYNEMLREGASKQELAAQMLRVRGAEEQADAAQDELKTSEAGVDAAEERRDAAKEQYDLQSKLVDQLLKIRDAYAAIKDVAKAAAGAMAKAVAKAAAVISEMVMPEPAKFDIESSLSAAIDEAKERLKGKFEELFKPLTDAWDEMQLELGELTGAWSRFQSDVSRIWGDLKKDYPFLQTIENWVKEQQKDIPKLGIAWVVVTPVLKKAWSGLRTSLEEDVVGGLALVHDYIIDPLQPIIDDLSFQLTEFASDALGAVIEGLGGEKKEKNSLLGAMAQVVAYGERDFIPFVNSVKGVFNALRTKALEFLIIALGGEVVPGEGSVLGVMQQIGAYITEHFIPAWETDLGPALTTFRKSVIDKITAGLKAIAGWLAKAKTKLDELAEAIRNFDISNLSIFSGQSPAPLAVGLYSIANAMGAVAVAQSRLGNMAFALDVTRQYRQPRVLAAPSVNSTTSQHVTIDIRDVYISDREEGDRFSQRVEAAVLAGLRAGRV